MTKTERSLYEAILALKTVEECAAFLHDLCTPAEITAITERWHVAELLDEEELSYRAIHEETGVSLATIVRVSRFLSKETNQGYRLVLNRLGKKSL